MVNLLKNLYVTKKWCLAAMLLPFFADAQPFTVSGNVLAEGHGIANAVVSIPALNRSMQTDSSGFFQFSGLQDQLVLVQITHPDYITISREINTTVSIPVQLYLNNAKELDDIVVTATRSQQYRRDAAVAVSVLDARTFLRTQSSCLADGLAFQPGLRMETDCQTCNYTQLRMNGMGGAYSQILINGRPLFSSLMGLYGLEQIPASAIERVEVVRGSGSVLYGSNAIAGTINVLTKLPQKDELSVLFAQSHLGNSASEINAQAMAVAVNDSANTGISVFTSYRKRDWLDVNEDGFSELPELNGLTVGVAAFAKPNERNRLEVALWHLQEERRGGNAFDQRPDAADQSEYRLQNSSIVQMTYDGRSRSGKWETMAYAGLQYTDREHYTGIDQANGWGTTENFNTSSGLQFNRHLKIHPTGEMKVSGGLDHQYEFTYDVIPGYNYKIDQNIQQLGVFLQSDWQLSKRWDVLTGVRSTFHTLLKQPVWTPRISLLYKVSTDWRLRWGYGRGFKGPQAFETDMHMAFASGGIAMIVRDPNLISETSDSWTTSADWTHRFGRHLTGITISGFCTVLHDVFTLSELGQDSSGNTILFRQNGDNASVIGTTVEISWKWANILQLDGGWTYQQSRFRQPVMWSAELEGQKRFLRTPDQYGFATLALFPERKWSGMLTGVFTGSMLVPHFGGAPGVPSDVLIQSPVFADVMCKGSYTKHFHKMEHNLQFSAGVQNLFNSYQIDFDTGKNRDSNYIYGPSRPRTIFISVRWFSGE